MSRVRLAVSVGALAVAAALLLRPIPPGASAPPLPAPRRPARAAPPVAPSPAAIGIPDRDIFNYAADEEDGSTAPLPSGGGEDDAAALPPPPSLSEAEPPADEGPRLVGILRRGGTLKAALSVDGELLVVGAGDRAGRYRVLSVDEDSGVRLADEAGAEVTLPPR